MSAYPPSILSIVNSIFTLERARAPIRIRSSGRRATSSNRSTRASSSPDGIMNPSSPSTIISRTEPTSEATTGRPADIPSSTTSGKVSTTG